MSRYIDAKWLEDNAKEYSLGYYEDDEWATPLNVLDSAPSIEIIRCRECKKSHIDGKTTHYLWCTEWGRSTDVFGYCERGEREDE